ncbi:MAG: phosphotransferase [Chloroflexi bacterium]|nr:phosphotransferase [Chloroflexota bacterium]
MSSISLQEIRRIAEQESARHHHYYIGVEHLFIALTKLDNGLSNAVLEYCGLEPRFVRYSIRKHIGTNDGRRYWANFRDTFRTEKIFDMAQHYAGIHNVSERDLFLAIIDERDSIPVRVLQEMNADLQLIRTTASNWSGRFQARAPKVPIETSVPLSDDERLVLQRMFRTYERIVVERELLGSYTGARIVVVQPQRAHRMEARVVVKIAEQPAILHEKRHYDSYVKDTLPPTTARILDNPALPENCHLGGLKYTFVQPSGGTDPLDLKTHASYLSGIELSNIIRTGIYQTYAPAWWEQRQRYRFGVWREYEHVLPAAIEVYVSPDAQSQSASEVLEPLGTWSRHPTLSKGELIELRGFTVQKVRYANQSMQLVAGAGPEAVHQSSKVEVVGPTDMMTNFRPGDMVEHLIGRVSRTRETILRQYAELLTPPFDLRAPVIAGPPPFGSLPNPLHYVEKLLNMHLSGYLSIIHGDFHLGNMLVGPAGDTWLIDFGTTREGHVLFDWAVLEISLMCSVVGPHIPPGWEGVWRTAGLLHAVNTAQLRGYQHGNPMAEAFETIKTLREIVQENLAIDTDWTEYYVALALLSLRGLSWHKTTSLDVRRLLFISAVMAVQTALPVDTSQQGRGDYTTDTIPPAQLDNLTNLDSAPLYDEDRRSED